MSGLLVHECCLTYGYAAVPARGLTCAVELEPAIMKFMAKYNQMAGISPVLGDFPIREHISHTQLLQSKTCMIPPIMQ